MGVGVGLGSGSGSGSGSGTTHEQTRVLSGLVSVHRTVSRLAATVLLSLPLQVISRPMLVCEAAQAAVQSTGVYGLLCQAYATQTTTSQLRLVGDFWFVQNASVPMWLSSPMHVTFWV